MSAGPSWKVWLVFAGVFLAGGVAGGFISLRVADRLVERGRGPNQFAPRLLKHLSDELALSETQRGDIKALVEAAWSELREQREVSRDTMRDLDRKIINVLNPEQQAMFAEMQEERRRRWQALGDRDRRGDGHRRGPGPGGEGHPKLPRGEGPPGPPGPPAPDQSAPQEG